MKRYMKIAVSVFLILLSVSANVYAILRFLWSAPVSVRIGQIGPRSADLSVSCKPSRIIVGDSTTIDGSLINASSEEGLGGQPISLYYKQSGDSLWNYITSVYTGFDGTYSYLWIEASTLISRYYVVNATFAGSIAFDRWTSITDLQVIPEMPVEEIPVAILSAHPWYDVEIGQNVTLDASLSYDPDGTIEYYLYDYGDGLSSDWITEPKNQYSYTEPGTYPARVKVKDDDGIESKWSVAVTIYVKEPPGLVETKLEMRPSFPISGLYVTTPSGRTVMSAIIKSDTSTDITIKGTLRIAGTKIGLAGKKIVLSYSGGIIGTTTTSYIPLLGGRFSYVWEDVQLPEGTYEITASFEGDSLFKPSAATRDLESTPNAKEYITPVTVYVIWAVQSFVTVAVYDDNSNQLDYQIQYPPPREGPFYFSFSIWGAPPDGNYRFTGLTIYDFGQLGERPGFDEKEVWIDRDGVLVELILTPYGIGATLRSAANLYVTDPLGRHIGFDPITEETVNEIPDAFYTGPESEPQAVCILDPIEGSYIVQLIAIATGTYTLTLGFKSMEETISQTYAGEIIQDTVYVYTANLDGEETIIEPDPAAELEHLREFAINLPEGVFASADADEFAEFKKEVGDKINETLEELYEDKHSEAIGKLNDMKEEVLEEDKLERTTQSDLCVIIDHIISSIETLRQG